jgi:hypothetical protein
MNSPAASNPEYLLYSHYQALDQVQELGLIPVRLFRVLYPLWRVRVEGRQRVALEYDELSGFIARGIAEAGCHSARELAAFFGLELALVEKLLAQAREIGHLSGEDGELALTTLGQASLFERVRYEERQLNSELYFEALSNLPLTLEHYKIPILETIPEKTPFQAFYHFDQTWDTAALEKLQQSPDRAQLNLPDEIRAAELISREPVYLPVYFVEAREKTANGELRLLVFSQVRGLRDKVLEYAVNRDPKVFRALKARTNSRAEAVQRYFEQGGLRQEAWYLNENGPWGAQVMVDGEVFLPGTAANEAENRRLTLRSVGRYTVIYDWCIWVVCDDANLRAEAAAEQLVEWLQNVNLRPTQFEIRQKIDGLAKRLNVPPLPLTGLLTLARRRGLTRAAERLEALDDAG